MYRYSHNYVVLTKINIKLNIITIRIDSTQQKIRIHVCSFPRFNHQRYFGEGERDPDGDLE